MEVILTIIVVILTVAVAVLSIYTLFFYKEQRQAKIICAISIILSVIAILCSIRINPFKISDIAAFIGVIAGVMALPTAVVVGWNIYAVIDFKQKSKQIHDKADEVISSHTILSETLDSRFKENDNKLEERLRKERNTLELMSSYKRAVSAVESNPESSFREFIEIKIQSDRQKEIRLSELALSMMEYIARREDLLPKISKATSLFTAQQRKDFFNKAMNLINSLRGDFEELRNFVNRIYKVD